jgi:putative nucleotidyltransferase with HDIG domain
MTAKPVQQKAPHRPPLAVRAPWGRRYPPDPSHDRNPDSCLPPHTVVVIAEEADVRRSVQDLLPCPCRIQEATALAVGLEILSVRPVHILRAGSWPLAMSGIEILTRVRAEHAKTVQLLLAAPADFQAVVHAIRSGHVYCSLRSSSAARNAAAALHQEETIQAFDTRREGWSHALQLRDPEADGHSRRVSQSSVRLARRMGMDEAQLVHVRRGALLHDIGKVGVPEHILGKPGPLTAEERDIVKRHASYGYELLAPISFLEEALDIPHCHHERWDGTGYPRGLKGEEIPLAARVFAVVDVWDALCSDRPYRKAWPKQKTRAYIRSLSGTQFDPRVVDQFVRMAM